MAAKGSASPIMEKGKTKTTAEHPFKNNFFFYQHYYDICLVKIYHFTVSFKYSKPSLVKKVGCPRPVSCNKANENLGILTHL